MKNVLALLALVFALGMSTSLVAQNKISVGAGAGGSKFTGELGKEGSFGLNYMIEGKYHFSDKVAAGIEYSSNALGYGNDESILGVSFYGSGQVLVKGEYFFTDTKVKPYAGLGLGYANISTPEITFTDSNGNSSTIESETKGNFSISPRVGVLLGGFGIEFVYNLDGKTPNSENVNTATADQAFNYYTVRLKYVYEFEY